MRCHEARNLIAPYLDSELDAKTTLEIEQHLEACSDCARVFEAEASVDERIFKTFRQGQRTTPLWEKIESRLQSRPPLVAFKSWNPRAAAGALLALASGAVLLAVSVWPKAGSLDLAAAIGQDHRAYAEGKLAPEFAGALPPNLARSLGERLDAKAFSQLPSSAAFSSRGARLCHLSGVPVAWILGRYQDTPVSLIVFKKSELKNFPQAEQRLASGDPVVCTRTGRYQFAARLVGDHVVCMVAETSKARLEELLKSIKQST